MEETAQPEITLAGADIWRQLREVGEQLADEAAVDDLKWRDVRRHHDLSDPLQRLPLPVTAGGVHLRRRAAHG